jgi:hypothetical protein
MRRKRALRRLAIFGVIFAVAAAAGVAVARAVTSDSGVLNQTVFQDMVGDSGSGADLSSLTITSYADQTVSFEVVLANRGLLDPGESVQVFIDVNGDLKEDLNLSIWPTGDPSYLAGWNGSTWVVQRQLPELSEYNGGFSVRLHVSDLTGAAQLPIAPYIGVVVGAWSNDGSTGNLRSNADDLLPDNQHWIQHAIAAPPTTSTQPTTTQPMTTEATPPPAPPKLALTCVAGRMLHAGLAPGSASILSVSFYANGSLKKKTVKAPWVALIKPQSLHKLIAIRAVINEGSKTQTLTAKRTC